ncbi:hypothetical protein LP420_11515 [Massilia sp. B-10]|nr:hypothetical protein LP420_11515 [Massilia sp. B-10]
MKNRIRFGCIAAITLSVLSGCATRPGGPVELNLVSFNDFHGHLDATKFEYTSVADNIARRTGGRDRQCRRRAPGLAQGRQGLAVRCRRMTWWAPARPCPRCGPTSRASKR